MIDLEPGRVFGEYHLSRQLGVGGMGVVYLAERPGGGKSVAVKILREELSGHPEYSRRFAHEVRAASEVSHPSLVPILDHGTLEGSQYLVMPHLPTAAMGGRAL